MERWTSTWRQMTRYRFLAVTMLLGLVIAGCADRGQIVSIVASATEVLPGGEVQLHVRAQPIRARSQAARFEWSASAGGLSNIDGPNTVWKAPDRGGTYSVCFEVLSDVVVSGVIIVPRGSLGWAQVTHVSRPGLFGRPGELELKPVGLYAYDDSVVAVAANVTRQGREGTGILSAWLELASEYFFGEPLVGKIVGDMFSTGENVVIPSGTQTFVAVAQSREFNIRTNPHRPWLGIRSTDLTIVSVAAGSPADKAGLLPGDRIISIEGRRVSTPEGLTNHLQRYDVGERVSLTIRRGSRVQTIEVELGVRPGGL